MGEDADCILVVEDESAVLLVVGMGERLFSVGGQGGGGMFAG